MPEKKDRRGPTTTNVFMQHHLGFLVCRVRSIHTVSPFGKSNEAHTAQRALSSLFLCSGKYCGSDFPPIITSSGRFLWMRFHSDETIQYTGFKAVYTFIENPLEHAPDIGKCAFDVSGHQVSLLLLAWLFKSALKLFKNALYYRVQQPVGQNIFVTFSLCHWARNDMLQLQIQVNT